MTVHTRRSSGRGLGNAGVDDTVGTARSPTSPRWLAPKNPLRIGHGCRFFGFFTPDKETLRDAGGAVTEVSSGPKRLA